MSINGGTWTIVWPWPQARLGQFYTIGLTVEGTALKIYELYCDTSDVWQAENVATLVANYANVDAVSIAMFDRFYMLGYFNDSGAAITVGSRIRNPGSVAPIITTMPTDRIPKFGCCCNYNNQPLIGCIDNGSDDNFGDMGYNTVAWGGIGRADFRIGEDRTAGYMHMPWGEQQTGIVHSIMKLGSQVMVYGDGGKAALIPVSQPVSGYGLQELTGLGVRSGNHVAGNESIHGFVNSDNEFWLIDAKLKMEKLGYKEFIEDLTTSEIKVSYEGKRKRFYVSDSSTCYCITEHGAFSIDQLVTSVGDYRGTLCGFWDDSGDDEIRITTDTFDLGLRAFKTLVTLEVGNNYYSDGGADELSVSLKFRSEYQKDKDSFSQSDWIRLNPTGIAMPMVTANEFRARLKGDTYHSATVNIDSLKARVKLSDKRAIRGIYGSSKTIT